MGRVSKDGVAKHRRALARGVELEEARWEVGHLMLRIRRLPVGDILRHNWIERRWQLALAVIALRWQSSFVMVLREEAGAQGHIASSTNAARAGKG